MRRDFVIDEARLPVPGRCAPQDARPRRPQAEG